MSSIILDPQAAQPRIHQIAQSLIFQQLDLSRRSPGENPPGTERSILMAANSMENQWKILWKIPFTYGKSYGNR